MAGSRVFAFKMEVLEADIDRTSRAQREGCQLSFILQRLLVLHVGECQRQLLRAEPIRNNLDSDSDVHSGSDTESETDTDSGASCIYPIKTMSGLRKNKVKRGASKATASPKAKENQDGYQLHSYLNDKASFHVLARLSVGMHGTHVTFENCREIFEQTADYDKLYQTAENGDRAPKLRATG